MRRKDKLVTDENITEKILNEAQIIRLAMIDGNEPYLIAMNFVYIDRCLYMHCATEGRKNEIIKINNNITFQTDIGTEIVLTESRCTTKYMSVIGTGKASFLNNIQTKINVLNKIMIKYNSKPFDYPKETLDRTLILKVEINEVTGKCSGY